MPPSLGKLLDFRFGQQATLRWIGAMSVYPSRADIRQSTGHVRFVPIGVISASLVRQATSPLLEGFRNLPGVAVSIYWQDVGQLDLTQ